MYGIGQTGYRVPGTLVPKVIWIDIRKILHPAHSYFFSLLFCSCFKFQSLISSRVELCGEHQLCHAAVGGVREEGLPLRLQAGHGQHLHGLLRQEVPARKVGATKRTVASHIIISSVSDPDLKPDQDSGVF